MMILAVVMMTMMIVMLEIQRHLWHLVVLMINIDVGWEEDGGIDVSDADFFFIQIHHADSHHDTLISLLPEFLMSMMITSFQPNCHNIIVCNTEGRRYQN